MKLSLNIKKDFKIIMESLKMKINKSEVARQMGVDRRTVDKYLNGYLPSKKRNRCSLIDNYYEEIKRLLSDECEQRFYYKRILWQYLKDNHGLECAYSTFRAYITRHEELNVYFKKGKHKLSPSGTTRFETSPGYQAQFDWKEDIRFRTKDNQEVSLNMGVLLLSYSRFKIMQVTMSKSSEVLHNLLVNAFEMIEGVPKELITDNMKTVMTQPRTEYSSGQINRRFKQFADDFGFKVRPCVAGRPRTKGKVESIMKILDEIHAYQGELYLNEIPSFISNLNDRLNYSVHVRNSYKVKHKYLKVNRSNMITYQTNQYSVPAKYCGKTVEVQIYDQKLHVYYNTKLIVEHPITRRKLNYEKQHYLETLAISCGNHDDINQIALDNLKTIGELYDE
ncbi:IS21 family transposase [Mammaliicoccus sciuri]|uniref:IS21 family transposase n=1 Tax=Mammaliicoccus sciuri TaxID=1296 RepID=UPI000CD2F125|nr:IS21 family transposase [Mammaliicoccus sciuri]PNZ26394.1 IS21 family transposase [Mammaliicoccus sciuri]